MSEGVYTILFPRAPASSNYASAVKYSKSYSQNVHFGSIEMPYIFVVNIPKNMDCRFKLNIQKYSSEF